MLQKRFSNFFFYILSNIGGNKMLFLLFRTIIFIIFLEILKYKNNHTYDKNFPRYSGFLFYLIFQGFLFQEWYKFYNCIVNL